VHVDGKDCLLLLAVRTGLLAHAYNLAHGLDVEAQALGFGIFVANVAGERLLLFLEAFHLLDQLAQLLLRGRLQRCHDPPLP
jgi:hypothetical protein